MMNFTNIDLLIKAKAVPIGTRVTHADGITREKTAKGWRPVKKEKKKVEAQKEEKPETPSTKSKSDQIRELADAGKKIKDIAKILDIKYQHAHQVVKKHEQKKGGEKKEISPIKEEKVEVKPIEKENNKIVNIGEKTRNLIENLKKEGDHEEYIEITNLIAIPNNDDDRFEQYREDAENLGKEVSENIAEYQYKFDNFINGKLRGYDFDTINKRMVNGWSGGEEKLNKITDKIEKALDQGFKQFQLKEDVVVYRGMHLNKSNPLFKELKKVGNEIQFKGHISTTLADGVLDAFIEGNEDEVPIILTINAKKGTPFMPMSLFYNEEMYDGGQGYGEYEYLFKHNSKFKIISSQKKNDQLDVELEMID